MEVYNILGIIFISITCILLIGGTILDIVEYYKKK